MNNYVNFSSENCIGCNNCIRNCPSKEANVSYIDSKGNLKVKINSEKCISCGECIKVCEHNARSFLDDTPQFFKDLQNGEHISLIVSPSIKTAFKDNYKSVLAWLKSMGICTIYDSAYGSEISTWANIKYLTQNPDCKIITQPCAAVINYVKIYRKELVQKLSPVHSSIICTAIYMKKYDNITTKIASLSPCFAKKTEFDRTGIIDYNVTISELKEYVNKNGIRFPNNDDFKFDGRHGTLGTISIMPNGFKENLKSYFGNNLSILSYDGVQTVYPELDKYSSEPEDNLPRVFDVLSCNGGCNSGVGCISTSSRFEINKAMSEIYENSHTNYDNDINKNTQYQLFDEKLRIEDFLIAYNVPDLKPIDITYSQIEDAFAKLEKYDLEQKQRNCRSCGFKSCYELAIAIAKGLATPSSCIQKARLDLEKANNLLEKLAYYDELTGAHNKTFFNIAVQKLISANSTGYAYIVLNIDKFKIFNELFGYANGDNLLKHIAYTLNDNISQGETFARISSDVFHFLVKYEDELLLKERLEDIYNKIRNYDFIDHISYNICCKFGVCVIDYSGQTVNHLGNKATMAINQLDNHSNCSICFYNDSIRKKIVDEKKIENRMFSALENHEFKLFLQPKYSISKAKIVGAEALVRWQPQNLDMIYPDSFIPIFERNGFVTKMDMYMLELVCKWLRNRMDNNLSVVTISVNQSRLHFYNKNYIPNLVRILKKYDIPPSLIELEVTESMFLEDSGVMVEIINTLHKLGFKIPMDDFGTGYSSLSVLNQISVDQIKLDKQFFQTSTTSEKGKIIVGKIISMAENLNIDTIAEGVETKEQVDFLKTTKCDTIQGYYFSKPLNTIDFENLLENQIQPK